MESQAGDPIAETLHAYEDHAGQYIDRTSNARSPLVDDLVELTTAGDRVLELGTGPGRDAIVLEAAGLIVGRTDGAASFIEIGRGWSHRSRAGPVFGRLRGPYIGREVDYRPGAEHCAR